MASDIRDQERRERRLQGRRRPPRIADPFNERGQVRGALDALHATGRRVSDKLRAGVQDGETQRYTDSIVHLASNPKHLADISFVKLNGDEDGAEQTSRSWDDKSPRQSRGADGLTLNDFLGDDPQRHADPGLSQASRVLAFSRLLSSVMHCAAANDDPWLPIADLPRYVKVPKGDGTDREIAVPSAPDLIMALVLYRVLYPVLDSIVRRSCIGFRSGISTEHGLAMLKWKIEKEGYFYLSKADIRHAYPTTPHGPLLALLRAFLPADAVRLAYRFFRPERIHGRLEPVHHDDRRPYLSPEDVVRYCREHKRTLGTVDIEALASLSLCWTRYQVGDRRLAEMRLYRALPPFNKPNHTYKVVQPPVLPNTGILTGCPLSPLLLNFLLADRLDTPFHQRHPDILLIRYVDDVLAICKTRKAAEQAQDTMASLLGGIGFELHPDKTEIVDLRQDPLHWLGHKVHAPYGDLQVQLPDTFDQRLETLIAEKPWWGPALLAAVGKLNYHAPAISKPMRKHLIGKVDGLIRKYGLHTTGGLPYTLKQVADNIKGQHHNQLRRWDDIQRTVSTWFITGDMQHPPTTQKGGT